MDGVATLGLPEFGRRVRTLKCGCIETRVRHAFAAITLLTTKRGCASHDDFAPRVPTLRRGISKTLRFEILKRDDFRCRYCGRPAPTVELEVDHVLAVANGGPTVRENLVAACFDCNSGKRDRLLGSGGFE